MHENVIWDDSNYKLMDIIDELNGGEEPQIPLLCPICKNRNAHIYMHRWEKNGTIWTWCSKCKSCTHASRVALPDWWENSGFIDVSELTAHPIFLDSKSPLVDEHLRLLLGKRKNVIRE